MDTIMIFLLVSLMASGMLWVSSKRKIGIVFLFSWGIIFSLFSFTSFYFIKNIYAITTYEKTIGTVVEVHTREERGKRENYLMYQPTYSFYDGHKDINFTSDYFTGKEFYIGEEVEVGFNGKDCIELRESFYVSFYLKFLMMGISFVILTLMWLSALNKKIEKDLVFDLFTKIILGTILAGVLFAILNKFYWVSIGEDKVDAMGIVIMSLFSIILTFVLIGIYYTKSSKKAKIGTKVKKKTKRKHKVEKKKYYQEKDDNMIGFYAWIFISTIFSSIGIGLFIDKGITIISLIFGLIGFLTLYISIHYFLSAKYFKKYELHLSSPIRTRKKLVGYISITEDVNLETNFSLILKNTKRISYINSKKEKDYKEKVLWEKKHEKKAINNESTWKIPFDFQMEDYNKGKLILVISTDIKFFTLSREYLLDKRGN